MTEPISNTNLFINILTAPSVAFAALKEQPRIFFPLLLLVIVSALMLTSFYMTVDYVWMVDQLVAAESNNLSESEQEQMRAAMMAMPPMVMGIISVVGAVVGIPAILAVMTAYLLLVNKVMDKQNFAFPSWLSLVCWTSMPSLFASLASMVNILLAHNGQLGIENLNPITFNNLLFHLEPKDPLFGPLNSLDPTYIWSTALLILGYSHWTGRGLGQSALIVLVPVASIYGIWIAVALS